MDKRNYNYLCVIYEDDKDFDTQMFNLLQENEVIYIRHDKDVTEEGEEKKPHYHFVIKLKTACTLSALSKRLGIAENMIEPIKKSFNGSLKYLIHFKDDNKYNYDMDDVKSNSEKLLKRFKELVSDEIPGGDHVILIVKQIISKCVIWVVMQILLEFGIISCVIINIYVILSQNIMERYLRRSITLIVIFTIVS